MENPCGGSGSTASHRCPFHRGWEHPALMEMAAGEAQVTQTFKNLAAVVQVPTLNAPDCIYLGKNL